MNIPLNARMKEIKLKIEESTNKDNEKIITIFYQLDNGSWLFIFKGKPGNA